MKTPKPFFVASLALMILTACTPQQASEESHPVETSPSSMSAVETTTATAAPTSTAPSSASSSPGTFAATPSTATQTNETAQSAPLSESSAGTPLSLGQFHRYSDGWSDGSYAIADESGITGIGAELAQCTSTPKHSDMGDSYGSKVETLRLNLGQKFEKLNFKAGQDLNSDVLDRTVSYRVTDGKQQIGDIHTVNYDEISSLEIDVSGQSAVFIQVYASSNDGESCTSDSVTAVMYDIYLD